MPGSSALVSSTLGALFFLLANTGSASAQGDAATAAAAPEQPASTAQEIVVYGRAIQQIGIAQAASEGTVSGADLLVRPLLRVAELVESVPGLIAAQHSGSGKANQYFLRGFNLDHGTDFTTYIDGVQMNLRTHGHGQGYLDLNGLIPEVIQGEDYRKGPYRADGGDFALAGAAYMQTIDGYDQDWISAEGGSYGYRRVAAGGTFDLGPGKLTGVGEWRTYNGPWQRGEDLKHYAAFAKYEQLTDIGFFDWTTHFYYGHWLPTEQIPDRAIGTSICPDIYCALDPTAAGQTTRLVSSGRMQGDNWIANAYVQFYDWWMYSNPTYHNPDGTSAQILQFDKRWIYGLNGDAHFAIADNLDLRIGTENRYDDIGNVGVFHTIDRSFVNSLGRYAVTEGSAALFGEATWTPTMDIRVIAGLRGDYYTYDVKAKDAAAAAVGTGSGHDSILSPKIALAYTVNDSIEVYANWGRGFHSNDVRGAVVASNPVPVLVPGTGKEVGVRYQRGTFSVTATRWWLTLQSELNFVGDNNAVEPKGASTRYGWEFVAFWRPVEWLALDATFAINHARYDNGDRITGAFENMGSVGASAVLDRWEASLRLRHLGEYPLIEDNSQTDPGSDIVSLRVAFKPGNWELYGEIFNLFDTKANDADFYYGAYLPAIDGPFQSPAWDADGGPLGRLSRVVEPFTVRVGAKYYF